MFKKHQTDSGLIFQRCEIDFGSIKDYIKNYTQSGDYIIPVCGNQKTIWHVDNEEEIENEEFINKYDDRLIPIYRHQDDEIILKNPRKFGDQDPNKKGLLFKVLETIEKYDETLKKVPEKIIKKIVEIIQQSYDSKFTDKFTGIILETHVWIPVWKINSETAIVVTLFGRINLIFT